MSLTVYLGIDVGSVTTKLALVDEKGKYVDSFMLRTAGKPVMAVQKGLKELYAKKLTDYNVMGVGTTGSGRNLAGALVGADIIKNEIPHTLLRQVLMSPVCRQFLKSAVRIARLFYFATVLLQTLP